jgi:putative ABC transport system permease protein
MEGVCFKQSAAVLFSGCGFQGDVQAGEPECPDGSDLFYPCNFIASLGLFGLTSFTVEQRTKEIGVRKAMGSSVAGIYVVISREVVILVSLSALIAWPLIYYWAGKWLQNFYYKINLGFFSLIMGLVIALGIAVLTISYRIVRAARVNPAQSLKYE